MMNKKLKMRVSNLETRVGVTEKVAIGGAISSAVGIGLGMVNAISMRSWKKTVAENSSVVRELCEKLNEVSTFSDDGESV